MVKDWPAPQGTVKVPDGLMVPPPGVLLPSASRISVYAVIVNGPIGLNAALMLWFDVISLNGAPLIVNGLGQVPEQRVEPSTFTDVRA